MNQVQKVCTNTLKKISFVFIQFYLIGEPGRSIPGSPGIDGYPGQSGLPGAKGK